MLFQFVTSGAVYKFDFAFLLQVLVSAAVMLKLANVATDAVAFYCLPGAELSLDLTTSGRSHTFCCCC